MLINMRWFLSVLCAMSFVACTGGNGNNPVNPNAGPVGYADLVPSSPTTSCDASGNCSFSGTVTNNGTCSGNNLTGETMLASRRTVVSSASVVKREGFPPVVTWEIRGAILPGQTAAYSGCCFSAADLAQPDTYLASSVVTYFPDHAVCKF